jgi:hypothetical protein
MPIAGLHSGWSGPHKCKRVVHGPSRGWRLT